MISPVLGIQYDAQTFNNIHVTLHAFPDPYYTSNTLTLGRIYILNFFFLFLCFFLTVSNVTMFIPPRIHDNM